MREAINLFISRIKSQQNNRRMFRRLFTFPFVMKNLFKLNYYYYFKKGVAPPVLNINLKVTGKCNANCYFCFSDVTSVPEKGEKELSLEEITHFINQFGKEKKAFFITGGEPFLRRDIYEILNAIKQQGSYCGIVTNGTLLKSGFAEKLIEADIDNIVFSLHGTSNINDALMGVKGAFDKIINSISELRSRRDERKKDRPYVLVNTVITPENIESLNEVIDVCSGAGADAIRFSHPSFLYPNEFEKHLRESKRLYGTAIRTSHYVIKSHTTTNHDSAWNMKALIKKITLLHKLSCKKKRNIKIHFYPGLGKNELTGWYSHPFNTRRKCLFLYASCFINEFGDVYPCQFYPTKLGNVRKERFEDIWNSNSFLKLRRIIKQKLLPGCARCCKLF